MQYRTLKQEILNGVIDSTLIKLYGEENLKLQKERYLKAIDEFVKIFGEDRDIKIYSAPGRTEILGNHTDHNGGRVIAASVNLDVIAVVAKNDTNTVNLKSEGYDMDIVSLDDLSVIEEEKNKSASLIRGLAKKVTVEGYKTGGFDAYTTSNVLKGSGLSSSAAFEVLVGTIFNYIFNDGKISPVEIAKYSQFAENVYFGKPCGLMDQMASSVGGMITIDFEDNENPIIEKIDFDFQKLGCALCIVDAGDNHADLTNEYASIPEEMKKVAGLFNKQKLRGVTLKEITDNAKDISLKFGDRALLRALHFVKENKRVGYAVDALKAKDYDAFLSFVNESGNSSFRYLQNVYANINPYEQGLSVSLFIAEEFLNGKGACRVHGGGFGGTSQNFVPLDMAQDFKNLIENVLGEGCCHTLFVRPVGAIEII